jgi:hypothetical protein
MADRVFCIDFGSAYTKVALRRDPTADTHLVAYPRGREAEAEFCFPSTVAVDRRSKPVVEFGDRAADLQSGGGIEVYRNWKKAVFQVPDVAGRAAQPPLEALLASDELRQLADRYGVAAGQVGYLQQLVGAAKGLIVGPTGPVASAESQKHANAARIAVHFFAWLRQQVLDACTRLPTTGLKYEEIPVRLAVPAFAHGKDFESNPGCKVLTDALGRAGWPLHPDRPVVAEPYSNAVGVLTRGANVLKRSGIDVGGMFSKGPLITVLKDPEHYPAYRAVVIDVGAFTTDFAAVELKPGGDAATNPDAAFTVRQQSVPLGISNLDARVIEVLPKEQGDWLRRAKALEWDDFRQAVYTDGKGFRRPDVGVIGGPTGSAVSAAVADFAKQVATEVATFCGGLDAHGLQELILTGGGNSVPTIRGAIQEAAHSGGHDYVKTHGPALKKTTGGPPVARLDEAFARGGSALGGASIYYEKDYYQ